MNPSEQKQHRTITAQLSQGLEDIAEATDERVSTLEHDLRELIGAERTHRLRLADEQRAYVDGEDRKLRACCQERWDATCSAMRSTQERFTEFESKTFWQRLRWLFRGV